MVLFKNSLSTMKKILQNAKNDDKLRALVMQVLNQVAWNR